MLLPGRLLPCGSLISHAIHSTKKTKKRNKKTCRSSSGNYFHRVFCDISRVACVLGPLSSWMRNLILKEQSSQFARIMLVWFGDISFIFLMIIVIILGSILEWGLFSFFGFCSRWTWMAPPERRKRQLVRRPRASRVKKVKALGSCDEHPLSTPYSLVISRFSKGFFNMFK